MINTSIIYINKSINTIISHTHTQPYTYVRVYVNKHQRAALDAEM